MYTYIGRILRINILHILITKNERVFFYSQKLDIWCKRVWSIQVQKWIVLATNAGMCVRMCDCVCVRVSVKCVVVVVVFADDADVVSFVCLVVVGY